MSNLKEELEQLANDFFSGEYEIIDGQVVPSVEDIKFGKSGKELDLTMLFVDIKDSTKIVKHLHRKTAARMYQTYLSGVSRIIRAKNGKIRSFNGDGLLAVFDVGGKNTDAAEAALKIKWFCKYILAPKMNARFAKIEALKNMQFSFGIGIDTGKILVVRGGIKGTNNNDLVWAGNATNRAVKLAEMSNNDYHVHISPNVYNSLLDPSKYKDPTAFYKEDMWQATLDISTMTTVYRSGYHWEP